jgi:hypothetical protein
MMYDDLPIKSEIFQFATLNNQRVYIYFQFQMLLRFHRASPRSEGREPGGSFKMRPLVRSPVVGSLWEGKATGNLGF